MDIADLAEAREQQHRDAAMADQRHQAQRMHLMACGRCHYCDTPVPAGALFCRPDAGGSCRDDFQREQDARHRNGG